MTNNKKGQFIVIDGTDGSGKATQTKLLVDRLVKEGKTVETIDFPQYGMKSAGLVEEYLNGKYGGADDVGPYIASVFYAVDRYDASFKIRQWLDEGKIVISNRYTTSNMGHQAGKIQDQKQRDKYLKWLSDFEFKLLEIPKPDIVMLLYMPVDIAQQRVDKKGYREYVHGEKRDIHEANLHHLNEAAKAYLYVAKKYKWEIIDANKSIEDVHDCIYNLVNKRL